MGAKVFAVLLLGITKASFALTPCELEVYRPSSLLEELRGSLEKYNVAIVPAEYVIPGLPPHRMSIVRGSEAIGQVALQGDPRLGRASLTIYDTKNFPLARAEYSFSPCPAHSPRGMCEVVTFGTEIGVTPAVAEPPFMIRFGADTLGIDYYEYGRQVGGFAWRVNFRQSFRWLISALERPLEIVQIPTKNRVETLWFALASDVLVNDWAGGLRLVEKGGRLTIYGRVPSNAVYSAVVHRALDLGFFNVDARITVDTGMRPPVAPVPVLSGCY